MFEPVEKFLRGALMIYLGKEKGGVESYFSYIFLFQGFPCLMKTWYKQGGLPEKMCGMDGVVCL